MSRLERYDPMSEKSQAFQEFLRLLEHAKQIIAAMYQKDEEEKGRAKVWKPENITPSDLEKVICNGIPINKMGNLKKCQPLSCETFQPEEVQQTENYQYSESQVPGRAV